jgi:hypothetical protein
MTAHASGAEADTDKATRRIAWWLAGLILLSFAFGVAMFLPPEHRAQKFEEIRKKYEAKQSRWVPSSPAPTAHEAAAGRNSEH